jgi:hypothetical protein
MYIFLYVVSNFVLHFLHREGVPYVGTPEKGAKASVES